RIVLLSPWSLDCVERVGRVLRQAEAAQRFADYPPRVILRGDPGIDLPMWIERVGPTFAVVSPADKAMQAALAGTCDRRREALEREEKAARLAGGTVDPGRLRALIEICRLAERAVQLQRWSVCPVCENERCNVFEARPDSNGDWNRWTFWCCCVACPAE